MPASPECRDPVTDNTEKRGRGRPRMAPGEAKTTIFSIRVTLDDLDAIKHAAERAGTPSASDWARAVLLEAAAGRPEAAGPLEAMLAPALLSGLRACDL
ncbi:MAG: hypothetical protein JW940_32645 [Polyangiaceae bacterium]|nr:hypothetical protein [Polyangiaceae bacterium]